MDILGKILEMIIYVGIGLLFSLIGYKILELIYKKNFNLSEEIDNHNKAIGVMLCGLFIAIGIIMTGVL